jgi:hypothetical protein
MNYLHKHYAQDTFNATESQGVARCCRGQGIPLQGAKRAALSLEFVVQIVLRNENTQKIQEFQLG